MEQDELQSLMDSQARKRWRRDQSLTPEQRMEKFCQLQSASEEVLASNPDALAAFHRRNRQKRRASKVRLLREKLKIEASANKAQTPDER